VNTRQSLVSPSTESGAAEVAVTRQRYFPAGGCGLEKPSRKSRDFPNGTTLEP